MIASLRVGVIITDAFGGIGGIAKFNRDLLNALAQMPEIESIIVLPRLIQRELEPIAEKIQFDVPAARGKLVFMLRALHLIFTSKRMNMVVCGHINLLPIAWLASRVQRCPLVLIVHGIEVWNPHSNPIVRALLTHTNTIVAVSRYTVERMQKWAHIAEQRFRIIPNCVDLEIFTPLPRNDSLALRYGIIGRRVLLTVGRLAAYERYKGFDEVLEVLPQLAQEIPDIVYIIAGDGIDRIRLQSKAEALGVTPHVVFTGFVSEEVKINLYNLADVFVMPSRGEGFGIVYLEAMACGVPVIGSLLDGSRDALRDGQLGQLIDPREPQQLIEAIRKVLTIPRGRPAGLVYFGTEAYCERIAALVREFIRQPL